METDDDQGGDVDTLGDPPPQEEDGSSGNEDIDSCFDVEYVNGPSEPYDGFPRYSTSSAFSPQPSTSMDDFEDHVSPLDPNMSSAARYSPVYSRSYAEPSQSIDVSGSSRIPRRYYRCTVGDVASSSTAVVRTVRVPAESPLSPGDSYMVSSSTGPSPFVSKSTTVAVVPTVCMLEATVDSTSGTLLEEAASPLVHSSGVVDQPDLISTSGHVDNTNEVSDINNDGDDEMNDNVDGNVEDLNDVDEDDINDNVDDVEDINGEDLKMISGDVDINAADVVDINGDIDVDETDGENEEGINLLDGIEQNIHQSDEQVLSAVSGSLLVEDGFVTVGTPTSVNQHLLQSSHVAKILSHLEGQGIALVPTVDANGGAMFVPVIPTTNVGELQPMMGTMSFDVVQSSVGIPTSNSSNDDELTIIDKSPPLNSHSLPPNIQLQLVSTAIPNTMDVMSRQLRRIKTFDDNVIDKNSGLRQFWCEECGSYYENECQVHRIQAIVDKPVPSRAWASLPATYLAIAKVSRNSDEYGVYAKKSIPKRTQFGPMEGVMVKMEENYEENNKLLLTLDMEGGIVMRLDVEDEYSSNWMRFVRGATTFAEQNVVLSQIGNGLFFTSTRAIPPRTELRLGYTTNYAQRRGLQLMAPSHDEQMALEEQENTWPCFECQRRFPSSESLQKHLNEHDKERGEDEEPMKSKNKRSRSQSKRNMLSRLSNNSNRRPKSEEKEGDTKNNKKGKVKPIFTCTRCGTSFPRNYSLQRHLVMHTGEKNHRCPLCEARFAHTYNRDRHLRTTHAPKEDETNRMLRNKRLGSCDDWQCPHCNLVFTVNLLALHLHAHAIKGDADIMSRLDATSQMVLATQENLKDDLSCPACRQVFSEKLILYQHVSTHGRSVHSLGKGFKKGLKKGATNPAKPCKCELCYKAFATDERLERHMLVHGAEDSKPLQCKVCYKRFLNNSALACHIKVHSDRKSFECPICREAFEQVLALKEHVHSHARNGSFTCPYCEKVFGAYNQIRKHIRAFHSNRTFQCQLCAKVFPAQDKLRMHMLRHSDHREFLCANCGHQFKRKDKLKEHMGRMHSAEREARLALKPSRANKHKKFIPKVSPLEYQRFLYKCHWCLLGFKRRGMLVNHLAKRHPDISLTSVPELNLPILKATRNYFCQYCDKVYKSSSKRKAHILKNHPGKALPLSNRKKGAIQEETSGEMPNPTFSKTVGNVTTHPHSCPWCHKQYASKAKLLQHQRKKHADMINDGHQKKLLQLCGNKENGDEQGVIKLYAAELHDLNDDTDIEGEENHRTQVLHIQEMGTVGVLPADYSELIPVDLATGILIDASVRRGGKDLVSGLSSNDLLSQAMNDLTHSIGEYRCLSDAVLKVSSTPPHLLVSPSFPPSPISNPPPSTSSPPPSDTIQTSTASTNHLQHLLSFPTSATRAWAANCSSYTAR